MAWTSLCRMDELTEGKGKYVEIDGFRLAVFLDRGEAHVMDNRCPHAGGSMAGGYVEDGCAVCPWHHWAFQFDSGKLRGGTMKMIVVYKSRLMEQPGQAALVQADLPSPQSRELGSVWSK